VRKFIVPLFAVAALALPAAAMAGDHNPPPGPTQPIVTPPPSGPSQPIATPPAFVPTPVVTEADANTFARAYILRNGGGLAGVNLRDNGRDNGRDNWRNNRNRVTVSDVVASCLQHPVVLTRFGCITRFNVSVRDDGRGYSRAHAAKTHGRNPVPTPQRVRSLGCLAALRINGGPSVTPSVSVAFADCVQRRSVRPY
jgi:hypothetical protein